MISQPRVLVVCKTPLLESAAGGEQAARFADLLERLPEVAARYRATADETHRTIEAVLAALVDRGLDHQVQPRPLTEPVDGVDLVVTVGGDGTFLAASHRVGATPMLGVNSSTSFSVGFYCAADGDSFASALDQALSGATRPVPLTRLRVRIDDDEVSPSALNEVLFAHAVPAGTSRYQLEIGGRVEAQKSSGVWVATPTGSTGAIHSAGGEAAGADTAPMQFLVREPYPHPAAPPAMVHGFEAREVAIVNLTRDAAVFLDGPADRHPVPLGARVSVRPSDQPLWAFRPPSRRRS